MSSLPFLVLSGVQQLRPFNPQLFTADSDNRDSQLANVQRIHDYQMLLPRGKQREPPEGQGSLQRGCGQKHSKYLTQ